MTSSNTINMAHKAGIVIGRPVVAAQLEHFAVLVAASERERIAAEWDLCMYGDLEDVDIGATIRARK